MRVPVLFSSEDDFAAAIAQVETRIMPHARMLGLQEGEDRVALAMFVLTSRMLVSSHPKGRDRALEILAAVSAVKGRRNRRRGA